MSWNTEKAEQINARRVAEDAERQRPRLDGDKRTHPFSCFDCAGLVTIHKLRDEVWAAAVPEYRELKAKLSEMYPKGSPLRDYCVYILCFRCVEKRLRRQLTRADFGVAAAHEDLFYLGEIVNRSAPLSDGNVLPSSHDLVRQFIEGLRRRKPLRPRRQPNPLWSRVSEQTTHGCGYSTAICVAYGFDPDEIWKPA